LVFALVGVVGVRAGISFDTLTVEARRLGLI
jgi:hypothetical protein